MKKTLMYAVLTTSLLASCSSEEAILSKNASKDLTFTVGGIVSSKAVIEGEKFTDVATRIGVFAVNKTSPEKDYESSPLSVFKPAFLTADATKVDDGKPWVVDGTDKISLSTQEANIYAYFPYDVTKVTGLDKPNGTMKVTVDASSDFTASTQTDYMFATSKAADPATGDLVVAKNSNYTANLFFHHALAKVTIKVIKGTTYGSGDCKLKSIVLSNKVTDHKFSGTDATTTLSLETGAFDKAVATETLTIGVTDDAKVVTVNKIVNPDPNSDTGKVLDGTKLYFIQGLVVPTGTLPTAESDLTEDNSIKITMNVDGNDITGYLPHVTGVDKWVAGKNYVYTITVTGKGLEVSKDVKIVKWADIPASAADVN